MDFEHYPIFRILKKLGCNGKSKAISTKELMTLTRKTRREIQKAVEYERRKHLICSRRDAEGGYYRPSSWDEILEYCKAWERMIARHAITIRLARHVVKRRK